MGGKGSGRKSKKFLYGKTCAELSRDTGISPQCLRMRKYAGWEARDIIAKKPQGGGEITVEGKTLREIATEAGLSIATVKWRYYHGCKAIAELSVPRYAFKGRT